MRNIGYIIVSLLLLSGTNQVMAQQDVHFSQFVSSPLNINPATVGIFDGDLRVTNNYRNQWGSVSSPYKTLAIGVDGVFSRPTGKSKGMFGGGLSFYNDKAGDSQMNTTAINLTLAYHLQLNLEQYLSFGLQAGMLQRSINYTNLYWDQQWTGLAFDQSLSNGESTRTMSVQSVDFGAGMQWFAEVNKESRLFAGVGVFHLTKPDLDFFQTTENLYTKFSIHGGAELMKPQTTVTFVPNFLVMMQGPNLLINLGSEVKFLLRERSQYTGLNDEIWLGFGGYYRFGDAFYSVFRLGLGDFHLGFSYDLNLSALNVATKGLGGMEIMIKYQTSFSKRVRTGVRFL